MSGTSGLNAIAHAVEALYARERNPIISLMAAEAIGALAAALPIIAGDPGDREARAKALYGAWLCGICLGSWAWRCITSSAIRSAAASTCRMPSARPWSCRMRRFNAGAAPEAMTRVARALGRPDPPRALYELAGRLGAKRSLRELGMPQDGIERVVEQTMATPYPNPRPLDASAIRELIIRAWKGEPPHSG